jgi:endonuclease VIII
MPEGDTIHKLANAMRPALVGQPLVELRLHQRGPLAGLVGARLGPVEALGKHLLIGVGPDLVLRTHLGMSGSWHRYRPGEPWRRPAGAAGVVLATARVVFVCFAAPQVELFARAALGDHRALASLGPDLLGPSLELERVVERARGARPRETTIGALLLDQGVACGLGNVYKSELLFIRRLSPWTPVADLADGELRALYQTGRTLLQRNLGPGHRRTTSVAPEGVALAHVRSDTWVYGRAGRGCLVCLAPIRACSQGDPVRTTYFCPRCQAVA